MKHISREHVTRKRNHRKPQPHASRSTCASLSLILSILLAAGCSKDKDPDPIQPDPASPPDTLNLLHETTIAPPKPVSTPAAAWTFNAPSSARTTPDLHGWQNGGNIDNLAITDGRLTGETTSDYSYIHTANQKTQDADDLLHSVEVTLSVTAGNRISIGFQSSPQLDDAQVKREVSNSISEPLIADGELHTYTIRTKYARKLSNLKQIFIVPTDQKGAAFKIESVKLIGLKNYLAENESMLIWQGLSEIYMDALVVRPPHTQTYTLQLTDNPWLDLNLGTLTSEPVTFRISVAVDGGDPQILSRTKITQSNSWIPIRVDFAGLDKKTVTLILSTVSENAQAVAVWGQPILRRGSGDTQRDVKNTPSRPQGVILIMADTLRKDHLEVYGYTRNTAPNIAKLASEGILFEDCVAQAPWTLVSTASIFTGLYPYTHAVRHFDNRLSNQAQTLAEQYRDAGYATLSLSSVTFTGQQANLHQGFETVHESRSLKSIFDTKTAQIFIPRLMPWLEIHKDVPFFIFLHLFDPHNPFKPHSPYDTMWVDPKTESEQDARVAALREVIRDPALKVFSMPIRENFEEADVDPEPYFDYVKGHYDGSIRGMDDQIGQLIAKLDELGLKESTLIAFISDHGEEFLEHGRTFHGQSTYGELMNVPFILWQFEGFPKGKRITETVETIDLMPTLLAISGLEIPEAVQGYDLTPLFTDDQTPQLKNKPAFSEKPLSKPNGFPHGEGSSDAVIVGEWKLIHNVDLREGVPEFELYNHRNDPLDSKNVADQHPEIVYQLYKTLTQWKADARQNALPEDLLGNSEMSRADIERLESIGYMNKNDGE